MKTFLEYFEEVSEMPKDELAAYVESELVEAMMDTDDDIYTEATNSEAHKAMTELRQKVSALKKEMKKAKKAKDSAALRKAADEGKKLVKECREVINDPIDDSVEDSVFGFFWQWGVNICYGLLASITLGFGTIPGIVDNVHYYAGTIKRIVSDVKAGDITARTFNIYKNKLNSMLDSVDKTFEKAKKMADKIDAEDDAKTESVIDEDILAFIESADYDDPDQLDLVEACLDLITEQEMGTSRYDFASHYRKSSDETDKKFADAKAKGEMHEADFDKIAKNKKKEKVTNGAIAAGSVVALGASIAGILVTLKKFGKAPEVKELESQAKDLQKQAADLRKQAEKGDVSPKVAEAKAKILDKKAQSLQAKAEKLAVKLAEKDAKDDSKKNCKGKACKESVDMDVVSAKLAIYEAAMAGEITMEEKDELLDELS